MTLDNICADFELLDQWEDRYRNVIELGRSLSPLAGSARTEANKVRGCASQVWLKTDVDDAAGAAPRLSFKGDSDAHIVRGLIAILFAIYSGRRADEYGATIWMRRGGRAPDTAALERIRLDGRAHSERRSPRHDRRGEVGA